MCPGHSPHATCRLIARSWGRPPSFRPSPGGRCSSCHSLLHRQCAAQLLPEQATLPQSLFPGVTFVLQVASNMANMFIQGLQGGWSAQGASTPLKVSATCKASGEGGTGDGASTNRGHACNPLLAMHTAHVSCSLITPLPCLQHLIGNDLEVRREVCWVGGEVLCCVAGCGSAARSLLNVVCRPSCPQNWYGVTRCEWESAAGWRRRLGVCVCICLVGTS